MARLTLMPSLREASCWNLLVVNGAAALRRRSRFSTACDGPGGVLQRRDNALSASSLAGDLQLLAVSAKEAGVEAGCFGRLQVGVERPVFLFLELLDLAFALDDEPQGHGLHASRGRPRRTLSHSSGETW